MISGAVQSCYTDDFQYNTQLAGDITNLISADIDGYQDDESGSYTGTPGALIERPDCVLKHLWCEVLGAPAKISTSQPLMQQGFLLHTLLRVFPGHRQADSRGGLANEARPAMPEPISRNTLRKSEVNGSTDRAEQRAFNRKGRN